MAKPSRHLGLKGVALFEASKGALVIVAGLGLMALLHHDAQAMAEEIVRKLHLNPGMHYPRVFLELFNQPSNTRLWAIGGSALVYAAMRFTEAYGLWRERTWASWLGVWSGGVYIPLELYEAVAHPTWLHIGLAVANAGVVLYLAQGLRKQA